jgi:hypothetical protein
VLPQGRDKTYLERITTRAAVVEVNTQLEQVEQAGQVVAVTDRLLLQLLELSERLILVGVVVVVQIQVSRQRRVQQVVLGL